MQIEQLLFYLLNQETYILETIHQVKVNAQLRKLPALQPRATLQYSITQGSNSRQREGITNRVSAYEPI